MRLHSMPVFAGVFMILAACVLLIQLPRGLVARIAVKRTDCGDGPRSVVVHVGKVGQVSLNGAEIPRGELAHRLQEMFSKRAERLLYLSGDPEVSFADVARIIDLASSRVDIVALLTPTVERTPGCLTIAVASWYDVVPPPPTPVRVQEVPVWRFWR